MESEHVIEQVLQIGGETHRYGHVRDGVFEDQIPADDPREDLAQDRVGVRVGAARRSESSRPVPRSTAPRRGTRTPPAGTKARSPDPRPAAPMRNGMGRRSAADREPWRCRIDLIWMSLPAAAVPVRVKMPEPITAPMPRAVRLHGPSVLRSCLSGSSEAAISASMLLVRKSWLSAIGLLACRSAEGGCGLA